jgi:hypothetical protein
MDANDQAEAARREEEQRDADADIGAILHQIAAGGEGVAEPDGSMTFVIPMGVEMPRRNVEPSPGGRCYRPGCLFETSAANIADSDIHAFASHDLTEEGVNPCQGPRCAAVGTRSCGRCKNAWYCTVTCQRNDWKSRHKAVCVAL